MPRPHAAQRGFILPGVVMFIFVLTIIGLSLFALSSYEAQFMYASIHKSEAFYAASGAIDRARFLLTAPPRTLGSVRTNLGADPAIVYARAMQGIDSTNAVQTSPGSPPVIIRVVAVKDSERVMLEASFDPTLVIPYDNLFSMSALNRGLFNSQTWDASTQQSPNLHVIFRGTVWQTYAGNTPPFNSYDDIYDIHPASTLSLITGAVPPPQVDAFWTANATGASSPDVSGPPNTFLLDAISAPDSIRVFKSTRVSGDWSLDINNGPPVDVTVKGIAIWMFDSGFRSNRVIRVLPGTGSGRDMLVLVARKTDESGHLMIYGWEDCGLVFVGGFHSPNVPVIMVSDGYVAIDKEPLPTSSYPHNPTINWLSVYSNFAWICGPDQVIDGDLTLSHAFNPNADYDLEKLLTRALLPNITGPRRPLSFIPGSWHPITDSDPD